MIPTDLRNLAATQHGLEHSFDDLRSYILNQVGRATGNGMRIEPQADGPTPMDVSKLDWSGAGGEEDDHEQTLYWTGKGKGKMSKGGWSKGGNLAGTPKGAATAVPKGGGKTGSPQRNFQCWVCHEYGH